jgi:hypothetical protein
LYPQSEEVFKLKVSCIDVWINKKGDLCSWAPLDAEISFFVPSCVSSRCDNHCIIEITEVHGWQIYTSAMKAWLSAKSALKNKTKTNNSNNKSYTPMKDCLLSILLAFYICDVKDLSYCFQF